MNTWHAGVAAAAVELRAMAARMRATAKGCPQVGSNAATLELAADALAELQPPAADRCRCGWRVHAIECDCQQPTGLEVRGG